MNPCETAEYRVLEQIRQLLGHYEQETRAEVRRAILFEIKDKMEELEEKRKRAEN